MSIYKISKQDKRNQNNWKATIQEYTYLQHLDNVKMSSKTRTQHMKFVKPNQNPKTKI